MQGDARARDRRAAARRCRGEADRARRARLAPARSRALPLRPRHRQDDLAGRGRARLVDPEAPARGGRLSRAPRASRASCADGPARLRVGLSPTAARRRAKARRSDRADGGRDRRRDLRRLRADASAGRSPWATSSAASPSPAPRSMLIVRGKESAGQGRGAAVRSAPLRSAEQGDSNDHPLHQRSRMDQPRGRHRHRRHHRICAGAARRHRLCRAAGGRQEDRQKGGEAAVVESVKAASEVYAPVGGEVVAVNAALEGTPATVNEDAEGKGWFLKLKVERPERSSTS